MKILLIGVVVLLGGLFITIMGFVMIISPSTHMKMRRLGLGLGWSLDENEPEPKSTLGEKVAGCGIIGFGLIFVLAGIMVLSGA
jgi:hypothetical protein